MKIAVDAMGGDYAPAEIVKGSVEAVRERRIAVVLVGDSERITQELSKYCVKGLPIELKHASQIAEMDESGALVLRRKPDASIVVAANLVRDREADAMVSAGNTGAAMAVATLRLGRIQGIDRPAIGALLPSMTGKTVVLDIGANVDCSLENLLQFAIMGSEYARQVLSIEKPRVGLLSIGEEASKGNEVTKAVNARLRESKLNFVGNVEGKDLFRGVADVVVCDGFVGNVALKVAEGFAEFMSFTLKQEIKKGLLMRLGARLMLPAFRALACKSDYAEYGGAPLLGVNGVCIICHGRSGARAIRNAIYAAASAVENNVVGCISMSLHDKQLVKP